jgi:hypothetical protein
LHENKVINATYCQASYEVLHQGSNLVAEECVPTRVEVAFTGQAEHITGQAKRSETRIKFTHIILPNENNQQKESHNRMLRKFAIKYTNIILLNENCNQTISKEKVTKL